MAKANDTAMEQLIERLSLMDKSYKAAIGVVQTFLKEEREQIDAAYNAGLHHNYDDAGHYFFMNYIDND